MENIHFKPSFKPTVGVEIELALVDGQDFSLSNSIQKVLKHVPDSISPWVKPELMQSYLEINTNVCETVSEVEEDLLKKISIVQKITDDLGLRLYWTGTHPFSLWQDQVVTPNDRYLSLLELLQETGRQLVTFGLHVHVGVQSGDKAIMICDRIMRHLPALLALSTNSPWWNARETGLQSYRSKIMESLPTAGLPSLMRNWSEYVWLINHLVDTGFINTIREIWWDVRPHHNFGTVEVRVCDMPGDLHGVLLITALIQSLVQALSEEIDRGTYQHDCHPMMVRQNKWRAARYGLEAEIVDAFTFKPHPARETVKDLVDLLIPTAESLGCSSYLEQIPQLLTEPSWANRQLATLEKTGSKQEMIRELTEQSRIN